MLVLTALHHAKPDASTIFLDLIQASKLEKYSFTAIFSLQCWCISLILHQQRDTHPALKH